LGTINFRLYAVKLVLNINKAIYFKFNLQVPQSNIGKIKLVEELRLLQQYKFGLTKNSIFEQKNSLGSLNIFDLCAQSLFNLVTEPLINFKSDLNSNYKLGVNRTAHQAILALKSTLNNFSKFNSEDLVGFKVTIGSFFDDIFHKWVENFFPIPNKYK
jgi:retron-type reverse transcriptase